MRAEEQAALLDNWFEAQKRMWDKWVRALTVDGAGDGGNGEEADGRDPLKPWNDLAAQAMRAWVDAAAPLAQTAGDAFALGSKRVADMFEIWSRAWRTGGGDPDWSSAASAYADQIAALLLGLRSWDDTRTPHGARSFIDLYWDWWEGTIGRLIESPSVGHTRELNHAVAEAAQAWGEFRRAATDYGVVVAGGWTEAWAEFVGALPDHPPGSIRDLLRLWGTTADQVLTRLFASQRYSEVQGAVLNAAMRYRLAERKVVDLYLRTTHVPSRTELDEANRAIHELRRELRALRKEVRR